MGPDNFIRVASWACQFTILLIVKPSLRRSMSGQRLCCVSRFVLSSRCFQHYPITIVFYSYRHFSSISIHAQGSQKPNTHGHLHVQARIRSTVQRGKKKCCAKTVIIWRKVVHLQSPMPNDRHDKLSSGVNEELSRATLKGEA